MTKIGDWVPFFDVSGMILLGKVQDIFTGETGAKMWQVVTDNAETLLRDEPSPVQGDFAVAGQTVYDMRETPPAIVCAASSAELAGKIAAMLAGKPRRDSGNRRIGGLARAEKLSPERRSEIAKKAADRRWSRLPN